MSLGAKDQTRLAQILKLAHALESGWPDLQRHQLRDLTGDALYLQLKRELSLCTEAEEQNLRRLSGSAAHLHNEVSLQHLCAMLAPFERLSNRALRDDEFLVFDGDGQNQGAGLGQALERLPLKLVVENLRSAFNVGALFRTSECLGVSEILLCGYTSDPDDEKTARTAMGTSALVPWRRVDRAPNACAELRTQGYTIVALETAATATSLHDYKFTTQPLAFVVGNERFGVDSDTLQAVDAICRVPMRGTKNSMNVGVAFGIAAFEWLRQYQ